jgi:hypothetical protein
MAQNADQYRLAVTVFDDVDALIEAILELLRSGLCQEQLCFAARRETLLAWDKPRRLPGPVLALIESLERSTTAITCKGVDIAVVRGGATLLEVVATHRAVAGAGAAAQHAEAAPGLWPGLLGHIRNGATVLVVSSMSPAQQAASTRMLLGVSQRRVQTYEFLADSDGPRHLCS